jgi:hypothetical protein
MMTKIPDIRSCLVGWLAVDSLTNAVMEGVYRYIVEKNLSNFTENLFQEIISQIKLDKNLYHLSKDKKTMPLLHAFYMETLRMTSPPQGISRYTKNGIRNEHFSIPSRSFIQFDLKNVMRTHCSEDKYPSHLFHPERYLENENKLHPIAQIHHGTLLPFGAGARQCPASIIVEDFFKNFIILTAIYFSYYRTDLSSLCSYPSEAPKTSQLGFFSTTPTLIDKEEISNFLSQKEEAFIFRCL